MAKTRKTKLRSNKSVRLFGTGFSMGVADLVPGVSGGTVALLLGIYDELLYSIKVVTGSVPKLLLKGQFKKAWQAIPFGFLVPVFSGILIAILSLVYVITYLLEHQPILVWSVFFGLIVGSALVVSKRVTQWNISRVALLLLGLISTYVVVGFSAGSGGVSSGAFFVTGAIAVCAMILPGISGSLIMVILGQYENVISAVAERDIPLLVVFSLGAIAGLAVFSRILSWLLHRYHSAMIAFLVGMLIGSLRKVWPWQEQVSDKLYTNISPPLNSELFVAVILALFGFLLVWRLEKLGIAKDHDDIEGVVSTQKN